MKFALIGAAAIAAAAFVTPAVAQTVTSIPDYCAQHYPDGTCQNLVPGYMYATGGNYRDDAWNAMSVQPQDNNEYRYHGGPKYND